MLTNYFCKCDKCGATRKFANRPFEEILKVVRRDGWRVTKVEKGWRHYCAECVVRWKKWTDGHHESNPPAIENTEAPPRRQWLPYKDD